MFNEYLFRVWVSFCLCNLGIRNRGYSLARNTLWFRHGLFERQYLVLSRHSTISTYSYNLCISSGLPPRAGLGRGLRQVEAGDAGQQQAGRDVTHRRHERGHRAGRHAHFRYVCTRGG